MRVENFYLSIGKKDIINNYSYTFKNDIIYNIYGPNGSGKSTFAKAIAGYLPYSGFSDFKNENIGLVSSYANIPEEVSVKSVIDLLQHQSNKTTGFQQKLYNLCNIDNIIDRKRVSMLSDGEKRKLMIYAALNYDKNVLILDEFMSGLDRKSGDEIRKFIINLHEKFHFVCLNITHSIEDARIIDGQILYLDPEQKKLFELSDLDELIMLM